MIWLHVFLAGCAVIWFGMCVACCAAVLHGVGRDRAPVAKGWHFTRPPSKVNGDGSEARRPKKGSGS